MNKQEGAGVEINSVGHRDTRYVKLFKFLQIDYFQQLIQSHL